MAINRPPVTGDPQVDSWTDEVTRTLQTTLQEVSSTQSGLDIDAIIDAVTARVQPTNAVTLVLYKRYSTDVLPTSEYISVDTEYTYTTGVLRSLADSSTTVYDGWTREIPPVSEGGWVFACQVNIADQAPTEVIDSNDWSVPVLILTSPTQETKLYQMTVIGNLGFAYDNYIDTTPTPQFSDITVSSEDQDDNVFSCIVRGAINTGVTFNNINAGNASIVINSDPDDKFEIQPTIVGPAEYGVRTMTTVITFKPTGIQRTITGFISVLI